MKSKLKIKILMLIIFLIFPFFDKAYATTSGKLSKEEINGIVNILTNILTPEEGLIKNIKYISKEEGVEAEYNNCFNPPEQEVYCVDDIIRKTLAEKYLIGALDEFLKGILKAASYSLKLILSFYDLPELKDILDKLNYLTSTTDILRKLGEKNIKVGYFETSKGVKVTLIFKVKEDYKLFQRGSIVAIFGSEKPISSTYYGTIPPFRIVLTGQIELKCILFCGGKFLSEPEIVAHFGSWGKVIETDEGSMPPKPPSIPKIERLQITEILPSVIETRERTYPVALTLKGKGFSQVNEITFSWRGPDSGGPKIWKKGDKNWVNSLKIKSDEEMIVNIYVLRNEPPTNEAKEWTWTVTLKNDKGETASKEFKVRQLPIQYSEPPKLPNTSIESDKKRQQIPSRTETVIVPSEAKKIIKPSQLKFYRRQNAIANYKDCSSYYCTSNYIYGKLFNKGYILTFICLGKDKETGLRYERVKQNPEVDFILPTKQGRLQGVLGLLDRDQFVEKGAVGDEAIIGIYGDGRLIKTYSLQVGKPPQIVDLDVSGIERITIRLENLEKILQIIKEKHCESLFVTFCLTDINIAFVDSLSEKE
jgi:hypothetical protein